MALSPKEKAARAAKSARAAKPSAATAEAETVAAPAVHTPKPAGEKTKGRTVVIVSKMPRGLYLDIFAPVSQDQRVVGGGIEKRTINMRLPERIRIKPTVLPFGAVPNYPIVNGFSLTRDVPADHWTKYREQNANLQLITEGLLAAFDNDSDAIAYCNEYAALRHGLEPIAQDKDPRIEQSMNPNVSDVEVDSDTIGTRAA